MCKGEFIILMNPTHLSLSDITLHQQHVVSTFLIDQNINRLPVDPFQIALQNNWLVIPYDIAAQLMGTSVEELEITHGHDGFVFFNIFSEKYIVCYNLNNSYTNIRFTLCHEIGHIIFKHVGPEQPFVDINSDIRNLQDKVCDDFALELLCPLSVLHKLNCWCPDDVASLCNVSYNVACHALNLYKTTKKQTAEKI